MHLGRYVGMTSSRPADPRPENRFGTATGSVSIDSRRDAPLSPVLAGTTPVLTPDEGGSVRQQQSLTVCVHGEEAAGDRSNAVRRAAMARPTVPLERVEPVVDGDLLASRDRPPGKHRDAVAHGTRIAGVVEI